MHTPTQGRIITVKGPGVTSNGIDEQAAVITRVWWYRPEEAVAMINTQVFCDCSHTINVSSIRMYSDRKAGEQSGDATYAFWPDRV